MVLELRNLEKIVEAEHSSYQGQHEEPSIVECHEGISVELYSLNV